jgi:crossover junction endodeoxyribonuclease RuvC
VRLGDARREVEADSDRRMARGDVGDRHRGALARVYRGQVGMVNYLGIDPGNSGALALVDSDGAHIDTIKLKETPRDVWAWLDECRGSIAFAVLEKVHSMPRQGVASSFKFGESFGFCQGMLTAAGVRFEFATPQKWQKAMQCRTGGDKNVSKARAQALFPGVKITHAIADALLIADYARRVRVRP